MSARQPRALRAAILDAITSEAGSRIIARALEDGAFAPRVAARVAEMNADRWLGIREAATYLSLSYDACRMLFKRRLSAHVSYATGSPRILKSTLDAVMKGGK